MRHKFGKERGPELDKSGLECLARAHSEMVHSFCHYFTDHFCPDYADRMIISKCNVPNNRNVSSSFICNDKESFYFISSYLWLII